MRQRVKRKKKKETTKAVSNNDLLEPLTLSLHPDEEKYQADWKCRYCSGYMNSASTEVCIQCNRARVLCEEFTEEQIKLQQESEEKKI